MPRGAGGEDWAERAMMVMTRIWWWMVLLLGVTACGTLPRQGAPVRPRPAVRTQGMAPAAAREGELMYQVLAGELAGHQKDFGQATRFYLEAARDSTDPKVAQRAIRIALFARDMEAALAAARRWVVLAPDDLHAHEALAALLINRGQYAAVVTELRFILAAKGGNEAAFRTLTRLLSRGKDKAAALGVMKRLVAQYDDRAEAHMAYSQLAVHAGRLKLALAEIARAIRIRPAWPDAWVQQADVQLRLKQDAAARAGLERAVKRFPKERKLRLALARVYLEERRLKQARRMFASLLEQDPKDSDALYSLGLLALQDQRYDAAASWFHRLLNVGARISDARYFLGRIEEERGHPAKAIAWYSRVAGGDYLLDSRIRIARLRAEGGDLAGARRLLEAMRQRNPRLGIRLYLVEGRLLEDQGRGGEAMALYDRLLANHPDNVELLYARALLAVEQDDLERAEADLRHIIAGHPDHVNALNALGYTLADRTHRYDEALVLIQRALRLAPEEPAVLDSMGWVQYRLGHLKQALEYLRRAHARNDDGEIAAHLGEVLWRLDRRAEARRVWREAARRHPRQKVLRATMRRFGVQ